MTRECQASGCSTAASNCNRSNCCFLISVCDTVLSVLLASRLSALPCLSLLVVLFASSLRSLVSLLCCFICLPFSLPCHCGLSTLCSTVSCLSLRLISLFVLLFLLLVSSFLSPYSHCSRSNSVTVVGLLHTTWASLALTQAQTSSPTHSKIRCTPHYRGSLRLVPITNLFATSQKLPYLFII